MKLTPTTSPVLQHFLTGGYDSPESYYKTDEDVHCPQAVTAGLNARSSGCVARLSAPTVDKCCRQCETGREILARVNPDAVILKTMCACGANEAADGFSTCQVCRDKANRYHQQKTAETIPTKKRKQYHKRIKKCECGKKREFQKRFCEACRVKQCTASKAKYRLKIKKLADM